MHTRTCARMEHHGTHTHTHPHTCAPHIHDIEQDTINWGYLSLTEEDYEWITRQLVKVANATCNGRIVSVLEGGYRIQVCGVW